VDIEKLILRMYIIPYFQQRESLIASIIRPLCRNVELRSRLFQKTFDLVNILLASYQETVNGVDALIKATKDNIHDLTLNYIMRPLIAVNMVKDECLSAPASLDASSPPFSSTGYSGRP
jgi:hypothetical protein